MPSHPTDSIRPWYMPLLGHTIKVEAFHSLVQVYVKVQCHINVFTVY